MNKLILSIIISSLSFPPVFSKAASVQKIVGKNISDINDIKISKRAKKVVFKKNTLDSIQDYTIPDHVKKFILEDNTTRVINGLTLGANLKKLEIAGHDFDDISNINFNKRIGVVAPDSPLIWAPRA